jgi:hypothetical protein
MLEIISRIGIALGLGLLIGLQRERTDARIAGFRTFPLVTLFGVLCGFLGREYGGWILAGGIGALAVVIFSGNLPLLRRQEQQPGVTTEVAMLVMFALGAYLAVGVVITDEEAREIMNRMGAGLAPGGLPEPEPAPVEPDQPVAVGTNGQTGDI